MPRLLARSRLPVAICLAVLLVPFQTAQAHTSEHEDEVPEGELHLPDEAEPVRPVPEQQLSRLQPGEAVESPLVTAPVCDDGTSGPRVQLLYVRTPSQPDTFAANVDTFRTAISFGDELVNDSVPGRDVHLRLVHSGPGSCVIDVKKVVVPNSLLTIGAGESVLSKTIRYLQDQPAFQDPDRKYLFFAEVDASTECGLASHWIDDSPGAGNLNNAIRTTHAGVGKRCWDVPYDRTDPNAVAAIHEVMHMLGSVSRNAPHASSRGHCTDENDLMCYDDGAGVTYVCGSPPGGGIDPNEFLLDCNDDDYFDPDRPTVGFLANNWNTADSAFLYGNDGDRFVALPRPLRAYDSRQVPGRLGPSGVTVPLSISPANPASRQAATVPWDATGVVLNVTAVGPTNQLNVLVWPAGRPKPTASTLNITPGGTIANHATVRVGSGGSPYLSGAIHMATNTGFVDIVVDVVGYYRRSRPGEGEGFRAVEPFRVLSSRDGIGPYTTKWGPQQVRRVPIAGRGGVPASADAVVANLTVTQSTAARSHLRAFPSGTALPATSSLNFARGVNTPNLVTVRLNNGAIDVYNHAGAAHVIVDVVGYYDNDGSLFVPVANERVVDTRASSRIGPLSRFGPGQQKILDLTGRAAIPANATAVVLNVTGVGQTSNTNLRLYPADAPSVPTVSNLNLVGGGPPRPNAVTVGLDPGGRVAIRNQSGSVDVVIDVVGYFVPA